MPHEGAVVKGDVLVVDEDEFVFDYCVEIGGIISVTMRYYLLR